MAKKKTETEVIEVDVETGEIIEPKRRSGKYCKTKGSNYERQIVKELKEITGDEDICTARYASKKTDDMKIDIFDPNNTLPFYIQTKKTQTTPSIKKINAEVGLKDKPMCILWNAQETREKNCVSVGEYAIIPKKLFYELFKCSLGN